MGKDWIDQIRAVKPILSEKGALEFTMKLLINKKLCKPLQVPIAWCNVLDDQIHYFSNQYSTLPILILPANNIVYDSMISEESDLSNVKSMTCILTQTDGSIILHSFESLNIFQVEFH